MTITLGPDLEAVLKEQAERAGVDAEALAIEMLRKLLISAAPPVPCDEWERDLLAAARPWGVSLSDAELSSEGLYD